MKRGSSLNTRKQRPSQRRSRKGKYHDATCQKHPARDNRDRGSRTRGTDRRAGDEAGAKRILKEMSDYVSNQKNLSVKYDVDLEVITPNVEKIQFSSSGEVLLSRPDKIRMARSGGYADVEMTFDGKTLTIYGKHNKTLHSSRHPGSFDGPDRAASEKSTGFEIPGADLLLAKPYEVLMEDVLEAKYIGHACGWHRVRAPGLPQFRHRLAALGRARQPPDPAPSMSSRPKRWQPHPNTRCVIKEWKTDVAPDADAFTFKKPDGVQLVAFESSERHRRATAPAETQGRK